MKPEDKDLLLKDLSARLPYGVKISVNDKVETLQGIDVLDNTAEYDIFLSSNIEEVKPYLFPLSNMTKDIEDEIYQETGLYDILEDNQIHIEVGTYFSDVCKLFNILNKYHLDYRGLIPMGLANDATNLNIY